MDPRTGLNTNWETKPATNKKKIGTKYHQKKNSVESERAYPPPKRDETKGRGWNERASAPINWKKKHVRSTCSRAAKTTMGRRSGHPSPLNIVPGIKKKARNWKTI